MNNMLVRLFNIWVENMHFFDVYIPYIPVFLDMFK